MAKEDKQRSKRKSITVSKVDKGLGVFINPRSDFGFKRLFNNANMMISFLNNVVFNKSFVKSVTFLSVEHFGETDVERVIISDTDCKTQSGENILVEMQNAKPKNFIERLLYYLAHLIRFQSPPKSKTKGKTKKTPWNYDLKAVYIVAIVNFPMMKDKKLKDIIIGRAKLIYENTDVALSDKLNLIIIDLTKFNKKEDELKTEKDFWLYTLKYAEKLSEQPEIMNKNKTFNALYDILSTNKLNPDEMKAYNDIVINMETMSLFMDEPMQKAEKRGERRGVEKGVKATTVKFVFKTIDKGFSVEEIADITDLTVEQVRNILKNRKQ
ncbi:MAG: Rpn family recombination-promoting nuclease/putative transposase [Prevotellaceae bacterium]|jgi:predicted transposase/invertase (TIGR01784 family)|nr:Rpn family recombination-promoting nuclease/putative transposase [Prevotellaceae bacterium]